MPRRGRGGLQWPTATSGADGGGQLEAAAGSAAAAGRARGRWPRSGQCARTWFAVGSGATLQNFPRNTLRGTRGALIISALRHRGVRCYICKHSVYKCERRVHICKRPMPLTAGDARPLAAHPSSSVPRRGSLMLGRSVARSAASGRAAPAWQLGERSGAGRTAGAQRPRCLNGLLR